ncbi:MAG: hypothetical protein U1F52_13390 [Burkholderiales bacterium]
MPTDHIEVSDLADHLPPGAREAAMRYAQGDAAGARARLEAALAQDSSERREWLMLLDLERLDGRWRNYEALVARYRMRFGEEAPTERERKARESRLPEELRLGGSGCVSLGGLLSAESMPAMAAIREAAGRHTVIHLDVTRVESADGIGCRFLHSALSELILAANGIVITGTEQLMRVVRRLFESEPTQPAAWELLLTLRRLSQDPEGFDRDAAAYSLATNRPAPAWEPLIMPQPVLADVGERREQPRYVSRELFALHGIIEDAEDSQLVAAATFARSSEYVNLNLALVERLSFVAATALAQIVMRASGEGRTLRLIRPNQLVAALLEVLNLGQVAAIVVLKG